MHDGGRNFVLAVFVLSCSVFPGCGKKGPPLAPLNLAPETPQEATARRLGDTVYIRMRVPAKSSTGRGAFSVDRLEVYAATIAPGAGLPKNTDLLKPAQLVTKIPVKPPPDPDAGEADESEQEKDTRPAPGDVVTFSEKITDAQLVPRPIAPAKGAAAPKASKKGPAKPAPTPPAGPGGQAPPPPGPVVLTRSYVVRGVSKRGNLGTPTVRIDVPMLAAPGPPRPGPSPSWSESSITIAWNPPATATDEAPGVQYDVYAYTAAGSPAPAAPPASAAPKAPGTPATSAAFVASAPPPAPLNAQPLDETSFVKDGAEPGKEQCFVVRSVATVGTSVIESEPSDPICVTPKDTFPPAAPKGLTAVGDTGAVNLVWDANTESDLAGYIVLRGEAPGDNMQPLMGDPIRETRYVDRTAAAGVTYFYTVIAVDKAGNRSTP